MSLLALLWWSSLVFGLAALIWMATLIVMRLFRERADRRRLRDHVQVRALFLGAIAGNEEAGLRLRPYAQRARLMSENLLEFLSLVRGEERDRLLECLETLEVAETLRRRLTRGSKAGRLAAAEALKAFPAHPTLAALREAMGRSHDPAFRVAAWTTLLDLGAAPPLPVMLADIMSQGLSAIALYEPVLRRAAAETPGEALDIFSAPDSAPDVRTLIADALGAAGDFRAIEPLSDGAASLDVDLRIASIRALGLLGHPAAAPAIISAFSDSEWEPRAAACEAAGRIGLSEATPQLIEALGDPAWWVRFRAGEALASFGDKGIASLQLAAAAPHTDVSRTASLALAERGMERVAT